MDIDGWKDRRIDGQWDKGEGGKVCKLVREGEPKTVLTGGGLFYSPVPVFSFSVHLVSTA